MSSNIKRKHSTTGSSTKAPDSPSASNEETPVKQPNPSKRTRKSPGKSSHANTLSYPEATIPIIITTESVPSATPTSDSLARIPSAEEKAQNPWAVPVSPLFTVNPPPKGRPIRIYCDGIFDLMHFGHAKALEQAKKSFPNVHLLVGVCNDELTHKKKGKTVLTDLERYESLRHCKWVDEVVEDAPWVVTAEFLDAHKIDYVAHDDIPYVAEGVADVYGFVKDRGQFLPTRRTEGISTSDLITRIVRDYDAYLRRNLERGVSAKELNIGFLKSRELQMKKQVDNLRQNWRGTREELKHELGELKNELRQTFTIWEEKSADFIRGFSQLFGTDGVVGKILRIGAPSASPTDDEESSSSEEDKYSSHISPQRPRSPLAGFFRWGGKDEGDEPKEDNEG